MTYKIGIIGERQTVYAFAALGFEIFEANSAESARAALCRAAASGEFAVLFLTETLAPLLEEELLRYRDAVIPAITVIPSGKESCGYAMKSLRAATERAVGADILK